MNNSDDFLQVKRGRPKKMADEAKRKQPKISQTPAVTSARLYSDLLKYYSKENYDQKLRNLIWNVPRIVKLPNKILQLPLQNFLEESVKQMMVTEPELAGFTLALEKLDLVNTEIPIEELLKICFFISKKNFESDEDILKTMKENLKAQFKNFEQNLMKVLPLVSFSLFEVNQRYEKLNKFIYSNINYTYYVDDIIRLSPPYQISEKKLEKKAENKEKPPFRIKDPKAKPEAVKESSSHVPTDNDKTSDQHLIGIDYYNLLPLEDNENYLDLEPLDKEKPEYHPFDFLYSEHSLPDNDDDLEMLLNFS